MPITPGRRRLPLKQYLRRNLIDEYTTEEVESSAQFTDALAPGEMLRVQKFYASTNSDGVLTIDFYMTALDGKRVARMRLEGDVSSSKRDFGFHFRFVYPPFGTDIDPIYNQIVEDIDRYLLLTAEFQAKNRTTTETANARKDVTLQPGMSRAEVIKLLGEPAKSVTFGAKTILTYPEITVELEGDKIVNVKVN